MTTPAATATTTGTAAPRTSLARIFVTEALHEFLKLIRIPIFAVSTITLPVMFYVLFGVALGGGEAGGVGATTYMMATYGSFGVIGAALFGFGVSVALERGQGWMRLKRVSPMPPQAYFVAKVAMSTTVSALIIGALFVLGATLGGVRMPAAQWFSLGLVLVLGALPFSAMGLAFGYLVGPNSAPAMLNLFYLPMAFASGLWIPIHQLPAFVQGIAPALPPYHFAQLALGTVGAAEGGPAALHIVVLLAFTALFLTVAAWGFRRDEGRTYG
ncbi:ABC transporter permease [Actinotalea sp. K2]|uniref:ABC transporter permease n=1 Tax=Actinotalea sp. K2 TaxID=2939438 RepID=UPI00201734AF|nr:ABC transporter permease [Actinotalea sp. K2]MCL3861113.1 ABC transporter permease [Actinotalea sp. K2]